MVSVDPHLFHSRLNEARTTRLRARNPANTPPRKISASRILLPSLLVHVGIGVIAGAVLAQAGVAARLAASDAFVEFLIVIADAAPVTAIHASSPHVVSGCR